MVTPKLHFILPDFDLLVCIWNIEHPPFSFPRLLRLACKGALHSSYFRKKKSRLVTWGQATTYCHIAGCSAHSPIPPPVIDFKAKQITEYTYWTGVPQHCHNGMLHSTNLNSDRKIQEEAASPCGIGTLGRLEDIANQPLWNKSKLDKYAPWYRSMPNAHFKTTIHSCMAVKYGQIMEANAHS